jgi:hypothetical protein
MQSTTTMTTTSPSTTTLIPTSVTTTSIPMEIPDGLNYTSFGNYKPSYLLDKGYSIVYDKVYSHISTTAEIEAIRSNCSPTSVLCMGNRDSRNEDRMPIFVCGNCEIITRKTFANSPNFNNGFNWYYTPNDRIGPSHFFWYLDNVGGGGSYVNPDAQYYKMFFQKLY